MQIEGRMSLASLISNFESEPISIVFTSFVIVCTFCPVVCAQKYLKVYHSITGVGTEGHISIIPFISNFRYGLI